MMLLVYVTDMQISKKQPPMIFTTSLRISINHKGGADMALMAVHFCGGKLMSTQITTNSSQLNSTLLPPNPSHPPLSLSAMARTPSHRLLTGHHHRKATRRQATIISSSSPTCVG